MEGRAHLGEKGGQLLQPTTPLGRFLSSPCERELSDLKRLVKKDEMRIIRQVDQFFEPSPLGTIGVLPHGVLLDEPRIYDGLLVGGGDAYCTGFNKGEFGEESVKEIVKGVKGASCSSSSASSTNANLVKGQWTAEEDR